MAEIEITRLREAMDYEGATNVAEFARAAIRKRVARILREKAKEEAGGSGSRADET